MSIQYFTYKNAHFSNSVNSWESTLGTENLPLSNFMLIGLHFGRGFQHQQHIPPRGQGQNICFGR